MKILLEQKAPAGIALEGAMSADEEDRNVILIYQIPLKSEAPTRSYTGGYTISFSPTAFNPVALNGSFTYNNIMNCSALECAEESSIVNDGMCYGLSESPSIQLRQKKTGMDNAMLRVSEKDCGEYPKLDYKKLKRDTNYHIRVTYQFYKVSDDNELSED